MSVMSFLAPIIGQIYYGHEFGNLSFPEPALDMFERAYRLYNERRYDHCLIEVWKHIEGILKNSCSGPRPEKTSKLIWKLRNSGFLEESDAFLLQGIHQYRNKATHDKKLSDMDTLVIKGILILVVPLIWKLHYIEEAWH